jgi:hypothetical protein
MFGGNWGSGFSGKSTCQVKTLSSTPSTTKKKERPPDTGDTVQW